jgi:outer membrane receptor protein involved in Fe transport
MTGPGAATYYSQSQAAPGAGSAVFVNQIGNPNLKSERAYTWTAGVVLSSPLMNPWTERLRLTLDWYKIKIKDAIAFSDIDYANQQCLQQDASTPAALAAALNTTACKGFLRNPATGGVDLNTLIYGNLGFIDTSGVDAELNWTVNFDSVGMKSIPGSVNLNVLANWLDYYITQSSPDSPFYDWTGTFGPTLTGTNGGAFKYKLNTTLSYMEGPMSLGITWRHLPGLKPTSAITSDGVTTFNTTFNTPSHDEFDLFGTWSIKRNYILRFGVNNLFNAQPPIGGNPPGGANSGAPTGAGGTPTVPQSGQGSTNELLYDAIGRRFFVGLRATF